MHIRSIYTCCTGLDLKRCLHCELVLSAATASAAAAAVLPSLQPAGYRALPFKRLLLCHHYSQLVTALLIRLYRYVARNSRGRIFANYCRQFVRFVRVRRIYTWYISFHYLGRRSQILLKPARKSVPIVVPAVAAVCVYDIYVCVCSSR